MRKYLLSPTGNFYKTNLHCHSTYSDGKLTPEQLKEHYKKNGYSAIAFTDHDILIAHDYLNDDEFIALHGFETETNSERPYEGAEDNAILVCHICYIALDPDNMIQPCWHRSGKYLFGNAPKHKDEVKFDENEPDYERKYTGEGISDMMKKARDAGFFVTYNHPTWSCEEYPQYSAYNGMNAMEMVNHGCVFMGYADHNEAVYDNMLRAGKRIYAICTDDNHNQKDMCGGFTMIKAEKLGYKELTDALVRGDFYSSEAPEIKSLYVEDGKVYIETSPVASIRINAGIRYALCAYKENDTSLTRACFEIPKDKSTYFRLTVTDENGKCAYTNAYFIDELYRRAV